MRTWFAPRPLPPPPLVGTALLRKGNDGSDQNLKQHPARGLHKEGTIQKCKGFFVGRVLAKPVSMMGGVKHAEDKAGRKCLCVCLCVYPW